MPRRKFRLTIEELIQSDPVLMAEIMAAAEEDCPVMTADEAIQWVLALRPGADEAGKKLH